MKNGLRIYGAWAGDPDGQTEDKTRCIEEVWTNERWSNAHQCFRKRGHGDNGLYCKQHAKKKEEELSNSLSSILNP